MDTLQLSPRARFQTPESARWLIVGLSFVLAAALWCMSDLWRIMTWTRHELEMDGTLPRPQLLGLSLFALVIVLALVGTTIVAFASGQYELLLLGVAFFFLYAAATGWRLL